MNKKLLAPLMVSLAIFNSSIAIASCVWSKDIVQNGNQFVYSKECHLEVGRLVEENKLLKEQVGKLERALELSDLALRKSEEKSLLWMDTSIKVQNELLKYENQRQLTRWVDFGLGVGVAILSVWAAGQLK